MNGKVFDINKKKIVISINSIEKMLLEISMGMGCFTGLNKTLVNTLNIPLCKQN